MSIIDKLKGLFYEEDNSNNSSSASKSTKENYLENKNDALNLICGHLARYSYSSDKNLEVLEMWVCIPENESEVFWADGIFLKDLKTRLHQEMIEAIKEIKLNTITSEELKTIKAQDPQLKPMVEHRLYYKTYAKKKNVESERKASVAWLVCIGGQ